ncbi:uncharacterized protein LOC125245776 isoform X3 [Megalobrama amblycephala]|uniref:uncharacterized protein LOC125245776 isoform X3 n=1 Tax=Megalobrama amblycephala TaxID=75352 RepID=UPI002013F143|nr:uncharacterized protein LOC125245776 isoform X3 [Megalobrama amblycephala]
MTARVYCLSAVLLCLSACLSTTDAGVAANPEECPCKTSGVEKSVKPAAEPPQPPVCGGSCPQPPHQGDGHGGQGVGLGGFLGHLLGKVLGRGHGHGHDGDGHVGCRS